MVVSVCRGRWDLSVGSVTADQGPRAGGRHWAQQQRKAGRVLEGELAELVTRVWA